MVRVSARVETSEHQASLSFERRTARTSWPWSPPRGQLSIAASTAS